MLAGTIDVLTVLRVPSPAPPSTFASKSSSDLLGSQSHVIVPVAEALWRACRNGV